MLGALRTESENWLRLDMLRFVASAGIVWNHSHEFYWSAAERVDPVQTWGLFVDLFFVISGFIISALYGERTRNTGEIARFMQKRVARLIPLQLVVLVCAIAFWHLVQKLGVAAENAPDLSGPCIAHSALMLHGFFRCGNGVAVGGVSWSIGIEMALYLLFPLVAVLARRRWTLEAAFLAALILLGVHVIALDGVVIDAAKIMRGITSFLFGALLFKYQDRLVRLDNARVFPALLLLLIAAMALELPEPLTLALVYMVAIMAVAGDTRGSEVPHWVRKLAPWGALTYSIYMWHALFILIFMNALGDKLLHLSTLPMIALGLCCYTAIAIWSYCSWIYFERPARRAIDSIGRRVPKSATV